MVSTVSDLVSIIVLLYRLARRAEMPSHAYFEWGWCHGFHLVVKDAQPLRFLKIFVAFRVVARPIRCAFSGTFMNTHVSPEAWYPRSHVHMGPYEASVRYAFAGSTVS